MKRVHIFRAGKHTASDGNEIVFSRDDVAEIAASYNRELHEAPLVVGHPKDNAPAFGWIDKLEVDGDDLFAVPNQVNPDFDEMVAQGAFKKVSASIYMKDSPTNPTPGKLHIRHVGFLGAQPPAVKGLQPIEFSADAEGVAAFEEDYTFEHGMIARAFRGLREWIIGQSGVEAADKAIPSYAIDELDRAVTRRESTASTPTPAASFSESDNMKPEEIKAAQDKLVADQAALKTAQDKLAKDQADFAERVKTFDAKAAAAEKAEITAFAEGLIKEGKLLPGNKAATIATLLALPTTGEVSFAEGKETKTGSPRDAQIALLRSGPKVVDLKEHDDGAAPQSQEVSAADFGEKVRTHQAEQAGKGRVISFTQAAHEISATKAS